jgi:hypothetical protein
LLECHFVGSLCSTNVSRAGCTFVSRLTPDGGTSARDCDLHVRHDEM